MMLDLGLRILIVDDEPINTKILANILEDEFSISIATSGNEALQLIKGVRPELILMDIMMPDMDGITVCKKLKEDSDTEAIPVIFVTALDDEHNEEIGFKAGAVDYLSRPVSPSLLKARVKVHIQNRLYLDFLEKFISQQGGHVDEVLAEARDLLTRMRL